MATTVPRAHGWRCPGPAAALSVWRGQRSPRPRRPASECRGDQGARKITRYKWFWQNHPGTAQVPVSRPGHQMVTQRRVVSFTLEIWQTSPKPALPPRSRTMFASTVAQGKKGNPRLMKPHCHQHTLTLNGSEHQANPRLKERLQNSWPAIFTNVKAVSPKERHRTIPD